MPLESLTTAGQNMKQLMLRDAPHPPQADRRFLHFFTPSVWEEIFDELDLNGTISGERLASCCASLRVIGMPFDRIHDDNLWERILGGITDAEGIANDYIGFGVDVALAMPDMRDNVASGVLAEEWKETVETEPTEQNIKQWLEYQYAGRILRPDAYKEHQGDLNGFLYALVTEYKCDWELLLRIKAMCRIAFPTRYREFCAPGGPLDTPIDERAFTGQATDRFLEGDIKECLLILRWLAIVQAGGVRLTDEGLELTTRPAVLEKVEPLPAVRSFAAALPS